VPELARHCTDFLHEALKKLKEKRPASRGTVVILDSYEKLAGEQVVQESVENVFVRDWKYLMLPCHVIYTVPPWFAFLQAATSAARVHVLPMCRLTDSMTGAEKDDGVGAMMEVLRRRMPMERLFEKEDDLLPLARQSGGYPRDLLRMIRDVLLTAHMEGATLPIPSTRTVAMVERAVELSASQYETPISGEDLKLLAEVALDRSLPYADRGQLRALASLFQNHYVLSYRNGHTWFDLHPLVRRTDKMVKALHDLEAERTRQTAKE
jgi:hypothetical protein